MAYNKALYQKAVKDALDNAVSKNGGTPAPENAEIAEKLATALQDAISQLEVNTDVTTTGSSTAQSGTGKGTVQ